MPKVLLLALLLVPGCPALAVPPSAAAAITLHLPPATIELPWKFLFRLDERLIVPGGRLGKWTLRMTIEDLLRLNGPPTAINPPVTSQLLGGFTQYHWGANLKLYAVTRDGKRIDCLYVGENPIFKTEKGIRYSSPRDAVLAAYGRPTAEVHSGASGGRATLIYDAIGLAVFFARGEMGAGAVYVFRPGSARTLWKF